jgi:acyl carrier protein
MGDLKEELRLLVAQTGGVAADFDGRAHFYLELGVTSVKAMQLLMALEDRYGLRVPDEQFVEATSLESLTSLMGSLLAGKSCSGE